MNPVVEAHATSAWDPIGIVAITVRPRIAVRYDVLVPIPHLLNQRIHESDACTATWRRRFLVYKSGLLSALDLGQCRYRLFGHSSSCSRLLLLLLKLYLSLSWGVLLFHGFHTTIVLFISSFCRFISISIQIRLRVFDNLGCISVLLSLQLLLVLVTFQSYLPLHRSGELKGLLFWHFRRFCVCNKRLSVFNQIFRLLLGDSLRVFSRNFILDEDVQVL